MTGGFMTGKTTWIERMLLSAGLPVKSANPQLADAHAAPGACDLDLRGVYTPAVFENGRKAGIDAVLLPGAERFGFARRKTGFDGDERSAHTASSTSRTQRPQIGWDFSADALARADVYLGGCAGCDLLVIDELGPLELVRGEGFVRGMRLLDERAVGAALVVVRPALLPAAEERWGAFERVTPATDPAGFLDALC